ncbi:hypothetical protein MTO96_050532, partial [Rhipicephalus appendiculatus]
IATSHTTDWSLGDCVDGEDSGEDKHVRFRVFRLVRAVPLATFVFLTATGSDRSAATGRSLKHPSRHFFSLKTAADLAAGNSWVTHSLLVFDYGGDEVLICDADSYTAELTGRICWKKRAVLENYENKVLMSGAVALVGKKTQHFVFSALPLLF